MRGAMKENELQDLESRVETMKESVSQLTKKVEGEGRLGDLQADLVAVAKRLVAELRAETTAAFRSEAAAVAALDEQLWLTDQRLGQRIDELTHAYRDCLTVVENCSPGATL